MGFLIQELQCYGICRSFEIDYGYGLIKNKYIGRTFIQPTQDQREIGVQIKLSVLKQT